jgi:hypothetical protein
MIVQGVFLPSLRVAELWSCGELLGRADFADALEPPVRTGPIRRADEAGRRLVADELPEELGRLPAGCKPRKDGAAKARKGKGREIPARCAKGALGTHPFSDRCLENL